MRSSGRDLSGRRAAARHPVRRLSFPRRRARRHGGPRGRNFPAAHVGSDSAAQPPGPADLPLSTFTCCTARMAAARGPQPPGIRDGDSLIAAEYGGTLAYGPPYHVHTRSTSTFRPRKILFRTRSGFLLINGRRVGEGTQLCLTNPELRRAFLAKLRNFITTSWDAAKAAHLPPPLVFSVSQNDWANPCQCESCQAIAKAEGSEAGPLVDFVNFMADGIKDQWPEILIDTLAYQYTQQAPKTLKCRDNVIIRLCDTQSDMLKPLAAPENQAFRDHLLSWAGVSRNLRIWDYAVTYASPNGMPLPTAHTYGPDYRFYAAHNVEGVFTELEYPVIADLRDFKVWVMMKTLENADADYDCLTGYVRTAIMARRASRSRPT